MGLLFRWYLEKDFKSAFNGKYNKHFQSFYGFCVNLSIKYIVRLGYINIIVCSAEAMVFRDLQHWRIECVDGWLRKCKAWNDFFSYPDLLAIGCMVLYDIVPDFIQFMLTLSFKIKIQKEIWTTQFISRHVVYPQRYSLWELFRSYIFFGFVSFYFFFLKVDGMMEYNVEIGWFRLLVIYVFLKSFLQKAYKDFPK